MSTRKGDIMRVKSIWAETVRASELTPAYEVLRMLGGVFCGQEHEVELLDVIHGGAPENFSDSVHPSRGSLESVTAFAEDAGSELRACGIEAKTDGNRTIWVIGCYYPTAFHNRCVTRSRSCGTSAGSMKLHQITETGLQTETLKGLNRQ
jgi:hypothetical protein